MQDKPVDFDKNEPESWQAMLEEDTGSTLEAAELKPLIEKLRLAPVPVPTQTETARLLARLLPEMPPPPVPARQSHLSGWWPLLKIQLKVVRGEIWASSALVMAMGTLVTIWSGPATGSGQTVPLVLIAPLVTALGVAYLYGPETEAAAEIERATPVSPSLVLLLRLVLLYGFNFGLGLAGSVVAALTLPGLSLWPLVMAWLAPMTFLSALALLLSVLSDNPLAGILVSLGLWGFQTLGRFAVMNGWEFGNSFPDLTGLAVQPWLLILALLLTVVAFWRVDRSESWLKN